MKAFNKKKDSRPKEVVINKNMSNDRITFKNKVILVVKGRNLVIKDCYFKFLNSQKHLIILRNCDYILIEDCHFVSKGRFVYKNKENRED